MNTRPFIKTTFQKQANLAVECNTGCLLTLKNNAQSLQMAALRVGVLLVAHRPRHVSFTSSFVRKLL